MPRITTKEVPAFWVSIRVTLGTALMKSRGISMPLDSMVWAVKADTCAGTSCSASARSRAVTMTSLEAGGGAAAAALGAGAEDGVEASPCARAGAVQAKAPTPAAAIKARLILNLFSTCKPSPLCFGWDCPGSRRQITIRARLMAWPSLRSFILVSGTLVLGAPVNGSRPPLEARVRRPYSDRTIQF